MGSGKSIFGPITHTRPPTLGLADQPLWELAAAASDIIDTPKGNPVVAEVTALYRGLTAISGLFKGRLVSSSVLGPLPGDDILTGFLE